MYLKKVDVQLGQVEVDIETNRRVCDIHVGDDSESDAHRRIEAVCMIEIISGVDPSLDFSAGRRGESEDSDLCE